MRFAAIVALSIGILMIAQWLFFLGTSQVPELETTPAEIMFHLAAELLTALALIVGGAGLRLRRRWAAPAALVALFPQHRFWGQLYPALGFALWHLAPQSILPNTAPGGNVSLVVTAGAVGLGGTVEPVNSLDGHLPRTL